MSSVLAFLAAVTNAFSAAALPTFRGYIAQKSAKA